MVLEPEPIAVQSVTINESSTITLEYAETRTLSATVYPYNADNRTVIWSSSNTDAVGVDCFNGTITANNVGTSIITAQAGDKQATCEVTVKPQVVAVNYVTLNETTLTLVPDESRILTATAHPDDADDKTATWSSSNPEIVIVDSNGISAGIVKAISPGTATITAYVGDCTASCAVYVNETLIEQPDNPVAVEVESITLNTSTLMLEPNTTSELTATVTPSNANDKWVSWSTSNWEVAQVDNYGTVTTYGEGTATITAQAGGKTATCEITVRHIANPVTGITIDQKTLTLTRGETGKLTATVTPNNADYTSVTWRTTDWEVVDVDSWDGTVTARQMGTVTITATTEEGGFMATCEVTVLPLIPVENITLEYTTLLLACNETTHLRATVTPDDADDETVTWSSSAETIATVDTWGDVTARAVGTATITATAKAGGTTAECIVTVHKHSYNGGKCEVCGAKPKMDNGEIDENGVLTKYYAFNNDPVVIPEGVTGIGYKAFYNREFDKLTSVTIPDNVTSIGIQAFDYCTNLKSVTIPNSVKSIGNSAFKECTSLTKIQFNGTKAQWNAIAGSGNVNITCILCSDGHIGVKDVPTYLKMSGRTVVGYNSGIPANLVIPDGVTSIGNSAFKECTSLTNVKIPESVKSLENSAFSGCTSLTSVTIPNSVTSLENSAFSGCTSLTSVTIPNSVTSIGEDTFSGCTSLVSVDIPNSVTSIGRGAFQNCTNLTRVTIPASVTEIAVNMFQGCTELTNVTIPDSVTSIGDGAFAKTYLTGIKIPDSVTKIGAIAFSNCKFLLSIKIPDSVTYIGSNAFQRCTNLNSVTISNGVKKIFVETFEGCVELTEVTIPTSVTYIGEYAFQNCTSLKTVYYGGTKTEWGNIDRYKHPNNGFYGDSLSGKKIIGKDGIEWTAP